MKKTQLNFVIDVIMMLVMMLTAGVGLLIKYVLLPGFKRNVKYGADIDLTIWGLDRHQWGTIHLIISLVLLALVVLHIIMHWRQIICIFRQLVTQPKKRRFLAGLFLIACVVLGLGPLFINPDIVASPGHKTHRSHVSRNDGKISVHREEANHENNHATEELPIYGYMTLKQVADEYNVPINALAADLDIPVAHATQKLGQLSRQYGFHMSDVRVAIYKHRRNVGK